MSALKEYADHGIGTESDIIKISSKLGNYDFCLKVEYSIKD